MLLLCSGQSFKVSGSVPNLEWIRTTSKAHMGGAVTAPEKQAAVPPLPSLQPIAAAATAHPPLLRIF